MSDTGARRAVHLTGPAYNREEVEGMNALASRLERGGFEVYTRARDGIDPLLRSHGQAGDVEDATRWRTVLQKAAFALEVYHAARCDCLVFCMNGRVPDSDGAFLAAAAFTLGRPVVLYKRDHRTKLYGNDNAMLSGLSLEFKAVGEPEELQAEVEKAIARSLESCRAPTTPPPLVMTSAHLGRKVSEAIRRHGAAGLEISVEDLLEELSVLLETPPRV